MEEKHLKCFYFEHKEINAISYCQDCNIYMCNKCENLHSKSLQNHQTYNLSKDNSELFTGYCTEKNHLQILDFFCKSHNKLCCGSCITKMKNNKYGEHTDCDICFIKDIKDEKKNKLNENVKQLENLSDNINESINKIKLIYQKINENKSIEIDQKYFTKDKK